MVGTEADSRTGSEADSRWTCLRTQQNRLLWSPSLPACLQTAYEAFPERQSSRKSGRRDSNLRQPVVYGRHAPLGAKSFGRHFLRCLLLMFFVQFNGLSGKDLLQPLFLVLPSWLLLPHFWPLPNCGLANNIISLY